MFLYLSSSGVNTLSGSLPKSHSSQYSDLGVTHTPLSVDQSPDSGLTSTPVSGLHTQHASYLLSFHVRSFDPSIFTPPPVSFPFLLSSLHFVSSTLSALPLSELNLILSVSSLHSLYYPQAWPLAQSAM